MIAKLDTGGGALLRIGVHLVILFLIFATYVHVFFPKQDNGRRTFPSHQ